MTQQQMEQLKNRDYTLVIDRSGSMSTRDVNGKSRWDAVRESALAVANRITELDPDGITLYMFAGDFKRHENCTPEKVEAAFRESSPWGGTHLAPVMDSIFSDYQKRKASNQTKPNGEIVIVVTDGQPEDESAVARSIVNFTKKLENGDSEFGISFFQIGNDQGASEFLQRLDDNLVKEGAKFDIVDTKKFSEIGSQPLEQVLMAALTD